MLLYVFPATCIVPQVGGKLSSRVKTVRKVTGQNHMGQSLRLIEVTAINVCKCVFLLSLFNPVSSYESHVRMIRRVSRFLYNSWYSYCTCLLSAQQCLAMTVVQSQA